MQGSKSQIVTSFNALVEAVPHLTNQLKSPSLTDNIRHLYLLKLSVIKMIFDYLQALKSNSKRAEVLVNLCLTDGRCSSEEAERLEFNSIGHMRSVRDKLKALLASTVMEKEVINLLLHTESIYEVNEVIAWYKTNVLDNAQLRRFITRY